MPHNSPKVMYYIIAFRDDKWEIGCLRKALYCFQAMLVLCEGMNIRIIPKCGNLMPPLSPIFDAVSSTGCAAGMEKYRSHKLTRDLPRVTASVYMANLSAHMQVVWLVSPSGFALEIQVVKDTVRRHP